MLGATQCPGVGIADDALGHVLRDMGSPQQVETYDVGVFFGEPGVVEVPDPYFEGEGPPRSGCTRCGACMIGCPVGAKNTLDKNYLWLAERRGVRIVPETEALAIRPARDPDDGSIVPSNLGVNPALTITALAEYMMSLVPRHGSNGPRST